ncbi:fungal-specific transcription factor domain-containing protein [Nemania abortiva]|nr:fungal-specific transcription factor domain-containing protein [Nemania abortiva]
MSDPPAEPVLKRKRITVACNSCRTKKLKCDGNRPVCGRCAGYSYLCTWSSTSRHRDSSSPQPSPSAAAAAAAVGEVGKRQAIFQKYQQLVYSACSQLPEDTKKEIRHRLAFIQAHVCPQIDGQADTCTLAPDAVPSLVQRLQNRGYLGETSDVRFFNLVKKIASPESGDPHDPVEDLDNYDSEELISVRHLPNPLAHMPSRAIVAGYLDLYFSTIHIAYPFVGRYSFMSKLEVLQTEGFTENLTHSWLSLLYALLAIGAYYDSFRQGKLQTDSSHKKLFQRSAMFSELDRPERSVTQVSALLAQCFYLLATSEIERCWTLLGIAIRLGQCIGLHVNVENSNAGHIDLSPGAKQENIIPRVWYSLYVLDRLLALQLGRPPAIVDEDCHISIPGRIQELESEFANDEMSGLINQKDNGCASQYFTYIIEFSSIVGRILREAYHPRRDMVTKLNMITQHDKMLFDWKQKLPRILRFDLGHAFEKSVTLRRQRNMLAIKYHHIRTLIFQPYLCYPRLKGQTALPLSPDQQSQIKQYGRTCEQEAQAIIHLIHNVSDATEVVMNYPWWQLISCLICAGSVMIIAQACAGQEHDVNPRDSSALSEDIDICMQILEALSPHSQGAKRAWNMMNNVKERIADITRKLSPRSGTSPEPGTAVQLAEGNALNFQQLYCDNSDFNINFSPALPAECSGTGFLMGGWELGMGFQ